jgi:hypothetical protein
VVVVRDGEAVAGVGGGVSEVDKRCKAEEISREVGVVEHIGCQREIGVGDG